MLIFQIITKLLEQHNYILLNLWLKLKTSYLIFNIGEKLIIKNGNGIWIYKDLTSLHVISQ